MSITSLSFILFTFGLLIVYYLLPMSKRWIALLVASIAFYLIGGPASIIYISVTAISVYLATNAMKRLSDERKAFLKANKTVLSKEEKNNYKNANKKKRKTILVCTLVLNFGFLIVFKYSHFLITQVNTLLSVLHCGQIYNSFSWIIPLGISYYTLQATGYAVDVYWEKVVPERNPLKVMLFVSFFPQITQGPISEYEVIHNELFAEHQFTYENFSRGFQRMLWGYFKKMVIADVLSPYVTTILGGYKTYSGITCLIGAVLYMLQMYADFSGYMDIMCGYCEMLGIHLTENFDRPFFSKSVSEFWRRWHITLGAWLRKYIYYTVAVSKWNQRITNKIQKISGDKSWVSSYVPITIALVCVWSFIGLWHDASWVYLKWGLWNAVFIISSVWMQTKYDKWREKMHISSQNRLFRTFQVARTFTIITVLEVVAAVEVLHGSGAEYFYRVLTDHSVPNTLNQLLPTNGSDSNTTRISLMLAIFGLVLMLVFSLIQRKRRIRDCFNNVPVLVRIPVMVVVVLIIALFGVQASWGVGAFMYANF